MVIEASYFISAFLIGIFGSGHCLGMCGGIACFQSAASNGQTSRPVGGILLFNLGRITSYTFVGWLVGWIGLGLSFSGHLSLVFRSLAALLLIAMGLYIGQWWSGLSKIERIGSVFWASIQPLARRITGSSFPGRLLLLGLLWGWLPCGLVYSALAWSMTVADPKLSATLMFAFGLGTLPSMVAAGLFAFHLRRFMLNKNVKKLFGLTVVLFGIWTLPLPWNSWLSDQPQSHGRHAYNVE